MYRRKGSCREGLVEEISSTSTRIVEVLQDPTEEESRAEVKRGMCREEKGRVERVKWDLRFYSNTITYTTPLKRRVKKKKYCVERDSYFEMVEQREKRDA